MNKVFLSGRIATEPQLRTENGDAAHLALLLSVQHKTRAGEVRREAYRVNAWYDVALWGAKNLARGQRIGVCGYLTQRQVNAGGISALATEVVAEEILPMNAAASTSPPRKRRPSRTNLPRLAPRQWRKRKKADQRHGGKP